MRLRCCCGARAPPPRQVADCRFRTEGKVRVMHPEFGMGGEPRKFGLQRLVFVPESTTRK